MSIWFFINAFILLIAIWKVFSSSFPIHIVLGGIGITLILYNWTRHAVFSTIRSKISRSRKIFFANISKKVLPFHKYTGTASLLFIGFHAYYIIHYFGISLTNVKMITGLLALSILIAMVIVGWLRFIRTTYRRRIVHLYLGYALFYAIVIHLLSS